MTLLELQTTAAWARVVPSNLFTFQERVLLSENKYINDLIAYNLNTRELRLAGNVQANEPR